VRCSIHVVLCARALRETVGWVFWPVKTVSHITYTVLEGTLNTAQSTIQSNKFINIYLLAVDVGLRNFTRFECPTCCRHRDSASTICDGSEFQCDTTVAEEEFLNVQSWSVLLELILFMSSCVRCHPFHPPRAPFDHIWAMVWSGARGNIVITAL